jgi:hypothetical protein
MQELIYYLKKMKKKRNESFLHQRRNKEIYKLRYIEDFEANVEVSEDKILCKLEHTRKEHNESHSPYQGFIHKDLYDTASVSFHKCYLPVKVIF